MQTADLHKASQRWEAINAVPAVAAARAKRDIAEASLGRNIRGTANSFAYYSRLYLAEVRKAMAA